VVSFTLRPLYPQGKSPWYPLDRRLGGPQRRLSIPESGSKNSVTESQFLLVIRSVRASRYFINDDIGLSTGYWAVFVPRNGDVKNMSLFSVSVLI
jgi:hypothetical protein